MNNKILRDEVSTILLTDSDLREYVVNIISLSTGLDFDFVNKNLELDTSRVNKNTNTKYSNVDAIYKNDCIYINIEVNTNKSIISDKKNFRYLCNLVLKQVPPGSSDDFNNIYQINLNDFDMFGKNKFIYRSSIMEENLHIKRSDFITIIDINLAYLRNLDYNIIERKNTKSLEKLLYIFICDDKDIRAKLYSKDEIMDKVNEKIEDLTANFDDLLYYDKEEYHKELVYDLGKQDGKLEGQKEKSIEIAKKMLNKNIPIDEIQDLTNLTKEEIKKLQN